MKEKLEECLVAIWKEWLVHAVELQVFFVDAENRAKSEEIFYKMDEESIITIREELSKDFQAMAKVQTDEIRKILEECEDDQLQLILDLETYERERVQRKKQHIR